MWQARTWQGKVGIGTVRRVEEWRGKAGRARLGRDRSAGRGKAWQVKAGVEA